MTGAENDEAFFKKLDLAANDLRTLAATAGGLGLRLAQAMLTHLAADVAKLAKDNRALRAQLTHLGDTLGVLGGGGTP